MHLIKGQIGQSSNDEWKNSLTTSYPSIPDKTAVTISVLLTYVNWARIAYSSINILRLKKKNKKNNKRKLQSIRLWLLLVDDKGTFGCYTSSRLGPERPCRSINFPIGSIDLNWWRESKLKVYPTTFTRILACRAGQDVSWALFLLDKQTGNNQPKGLVTFNTKQENENEKKKVVLFLKNRSCRVWSQLLPLQVSL